MPAASLFPHEARRPRTRPWLALLLAAALLAAGCGTEEEPDEDAEAPDFALQGQWQGWRADVAASPPDEPTEGAVTGLRISEEGRVTFYSWEGANEPGEVDWEMVPEENAQAAFRIDEDLGDRTTWLLGAISHGVLLEAGTDTGNRFLNVGMLAAGFDLDFPDDSGYSFSELAGTYRFVVARINEDGEIEDIGVGEDVTITTTSSSLTLPDELQLTTDPLRIDDSNAVLDESGGGDADNAYLTGTLQLSDGFATSSHNAIVVGSPDHNAFALAFCPASGAKCSGSGGDYSDIRIALFLGL